jgi:hypothetical protein
MDYKTIDKDNFIEYSVKDMVAKVYSKTELAKQTAEAEARLKEIPKPLDDKTLLEWAKLNHPQNMDYSKEKELLEQKITENKQRLEGI